LTNLTNYNGTIYKQKSLTSTIKTLMHKTQQYISTNIYCTLLKKHTHTYIIMCNYRTKQN